MSDPNEPQTPGERLLAWRKREKLTQTACATTVGVQQATWCEWEMGRRFPQIKYAVRIARLTGGDVPVTLWDPDGDSLDDGNAEEVAS